MSNITPITPSFVFGYWRPWKENSNLTDSYLDYRKDLSLAKYGADTVGKYINQASKEQVQAINHLGQAIGRGMNVLSNQMSDVNDTLSFLNRNMDVQIEQQKLSNLLLQNIAELLRVPDSEKERQHSIELGIKFFVNASKDADLYDDALEALLKAESLMKQDYFVLHRIACIYLYVEKYINPGKALEYFLRAAKYASVESDPNAVRLANILTENFNTANTTINSSEQQIGLLAAESYEKAAFAAYVLGHFEDAVNYQAKALKFNSVIQNRFLLSKYQVRKGDVKEAIKNLDKCINEMPIMAIATFKEIDLINEPEVIKLIAHKNELANENIRQLIKQYESVPSESSAKAIKSLEKSIKKSYEIKISCYVQYNIDFKHVKNDFEKKLFNNKEDIRLLRREIKRFETDAKNFNYKSLDKTTVNDVLEEINNLYSLPNVSLHKLKSEFGHLRNRLENDVVKIGDKYKGGIVFYTNKFGTSGVVVAEKELGSAIWGVEKLFSGIADGNGLADGSGAQNTAEIVKHLSSEFLGLNRLTTAARICYELEHCGYKDWYLPTIKELDLLDKNLKKVKDPFWGKIGCNSKNNRSFWASTRKKEADYVGYGRNICAEFIGVKESNSSVMTRQNWDNYHVDSNVKQKKYVVAVRTF